MKYIYSLFALCAISLSSYAQVTAPTQPTSGPGGSGNYVHSGVTVYDRAPFGNADGFWLYEPANPKPDSANVIVFCHGLGTTNMKVYGGYIYHLVKQGNIVIAPRYQQDGSPISSSTNPNTTFNDSCAKGILRALDTLKQPGHVAPRLYNYFVTGHSVGGILTANITSKYAYYGLPKPLAAFSIQPGANLTAILLPDYSIMESDIKYLIAMGANDAIVDTTTAIKLFNETTSVPTSHKNLVEHFADNHGTPAITATHNEPCTPDNTFDNGETNLIIQFATGSANAVDFFCYYKLMDALMDCALSGINCDVAFGDTYAQKYMGQWSDGVPVVPLDVRPKSLTAINDVSGTANIKMYPNPATSDLYIENPGYRPNELRYVEFFDLSGRKAAGYNIEGAVQHFRINFAAGIYFYRVSSNNRTLSHGKLVVK